jgi:hypothetical protein
VTANTKAPDGQAPMSMGRTFAIAVGNIVVALTAFAAAGFLTHNFERLVCMLDLEPHRCDMDPVLRMALFLSIASIVAGGGVLGVWRMLRR